MSRLLHDSPVGPLLLTSDGHALTGCWFGGDGPSTTDDPILLETVAQLDAYFAGERTDFDVPLAAAGSDFQTAVWAALREIPYGTTTTYGELAASLGRPEASRAVGLANGRNPISVIVPCHRVIGAGGALTGYGGGLDRKRWLLTHEGALLL